MSDITGVRTVGIPTEQDRAPDFPISALSTVKRLDALSPQPGARWIEVACAGSSTSPALVMAHDGAPAGVEAAA